MSTAPLVSVVIPHLQGAESLRRCLASLRDQTFREIEIIVVDNASIDGSTHFIAQEFPEVALLRQTKNFGFAGGVNRGIDRARGNYVALLNDDAIANRDWIEQMVACLGAEKNVGACAARIVRLNEDLLDSDGNAYTIYGIPFPLGRDELAKTSRSKDVFAFSGGACLIRKDVLTAVGKFDEDFFLYHEDVDLSFRIRLAGYSIHFEPSAIVNHEISKTTGGGYTARTRYHSVKNTWFVYLKNMPRSLFWKYMPRFLLGQILSLASSIQKGLLLPHMKGVGAALMLTPSMLSRRRVIQKFRVLETKEVEGLLERNLPPVHEETLANIRRAFAKRTGDPED